MPAIATREKDARQPSDSTAETKTSTTFGPSALTVPQESVNRSTSPVMIEEGWTYPDGGLRAWLVCLGSFMFAATAMSWGFIWGVFQEYYHSVVFPDTPLSVISLIGGVMTATMQATAYLSGNLGDRYGYKKILGLSCFLAFLCILAASFSTQLWQVFLFQGFFTGLCHGLGMPLYMALPSQWFLKKRGLATGIAISGSGFGGGIGSLIARKIIVALGSRKTLLIYSFINGSIYLTAWFLIAERRPIQTYPSTTASSDGDSGFENSTRVRPKRGWLPKGINYAYVSLAVSTFVGIFGYLAPYYLISTYTKEMVPEINPDSLLVALPLIVMNISGGIGRVGAGFFADRLGYLNAYFLSFLLGGLSQLVIWTLAKNFASILAFAIVYGLVGGWFLSLIPVCCASLIGTETLATAVGLIVLSNAPGQLAGASIASAILRASGGKWYSVSIYNGATMLVGAICIIPARLWKDKRILARV